MGEETVRDRVYKVVGRVMNVPVSELNDDSSADTVKAWESLRHMNLVLALEEEFDVQFSDEQIMEMLNIGLIVMVVDEART